MKTLLILPAVALVLAGCATTQQDIDRATAACGLNGGVVNINAKFNDTVRVECANGAKFTFSSNVQ